MRGNTIPEALGLEAALQQQPCKGEDWTYAWDIKQPEGISVRMASKGFFGGRGSEGQGA